MTPLLTHYPGVKIEFIVSSSWWPLNQIGYYMYKPRKTEDIYRSIPEELPSTPRGDVTQELLQLMENVYTDGTSIEIAGNRDQREFASLSFADYLVETGHRDSPQAFDDQLSSELSNCIEVSFTEERNILYKLDKLQPVLHGENEYLSERTTYQDNRDLEVSGHSRLV